MGMFDRVWVKCPRCDNLIEFQSKAGSCSLQDYALCDAPPAILADLNGEEWACSECGAVVQFKAQVIVEVRIAGTTGAIEPCEN